MKMENTKEYICLAPNYFQLIKTNKKEANRVYQFIKEQECKTIIEDGTNKNITEEFFSLFNKENIVEKKTRKLVI